ncbi:uncharacterized protein LOC100368535 [Saccoglossus kowalevskii]|uniref:Uncharacterized protein LOC100368535 n=1 Tax=Saccoglossus kowalevskii TaxID=10224 RepID=A0ABM0MPN2_SACKO|nr:PREDICTED: uncharacterized protein LOC100368535 [Saccoglossus kowalevskii]
MPRCVDCGVSQQVKLCKGDLELCENCNEVRFPEIARKKEYEKNREISTRSRNSQVTGGIIINELLCFLWNKIDVLRIDVIVKLSVDVYDDKEVENTKEILYETCESDSSNRRIQRKGQNKRANNIHDMIILMHELDDVNVPCFVAQDLAKLPPVDITNIDVTVILKEMKSLRYEFAQLKNDDKNKRDNQGVLSELLLLRKEMNELKASLKQHVHNDITENLTACKITCDDKTNKDPFTKSDELDNTNDIVVNNQIGDKILQVPKRYSEALKRTPISVASNSDISGANQRAKPPASRISSVSSDNGFTVVKHKRRNGNRGIITGTKNEVTSSLRAVRTTPPIELFVSRLHPSTTNEDMLSFMRSLGINDVKVTMLKTKFDTYASCKLTMSFATSKTLLDADNWPNDILIRRFYPSRNQKST